MSLVATVLTADSLRLTAYRPDKDRMRFVECAADGSRLTACGGDVGQDVVRGVDSRPECSRI